MEIAMDLSGDWSEVIVWLALVLAFAGAAVCKGDSEEAKGIIQITLFFGAGGLVIIGIYWAVTQFADGAIGTVLFYAFVALGVILFVIQWIGKFRDWLGKPKEE
jgi:drug/metabolite transporter (DMT)-like permease